MGVIDGLDPSYTDIQEPFTQTHTDRVWLLDPQHTQKHIRPLTQTQAVGNHPPPLASHTHTDTHTHTQLLSTLALLLGIHLPRSSWKPPPAPSLGRDSDVSCLPCPRWPAFPSTPACLNWCPHWGLPGGGVTQNLPASLWTPAPDLFPFIHLSPFFPL